MPPPPPPPAPSRLACPVGCCKKTFANLSNLAQHIGNVHPGLSDKDLANEGLCRCPAAGCRVFTLPPVGTTNPRSGLQQHLQQLGSGKDPEHTRVVHAAGGIAALDAAARARAASIADPGTRGASLADPTAHTSDAALQRAPPPPPPRPGRYPPSPPPPRPPRSSGRASTRSTSTTCAASTSSTKTNRATTPRRATCTSPSSQA